MVPCDVLVPRAKAMFTSPDGGVAQLGATVAATVTAVTTPASPTPSSVLLAARFMTSSRPQSVGHSACFVGQACVSTPVIGGEGLLRLVGWAGKLRARDCAGGGASQAVRASSPDGGGDECSGWGAVGVVSGGDTERRAGVAEHAPGAAGGLAHAGGGGGRG